MESGNDLNFSVLFACLQIEGKTGGVDKSSIVCVDCVLVSIAILEHRKPCYVYTVWRTVCTGSLFSSAHGNIA